MAEGPGPWFATFTDISLSLTALYTAGHLFKDHRAPAVGFVLVGISAGLSALPESSLVPVCIRQDLEWSAEVLGPVLVSCGFLWLSEDHQTAHVLLSCAVLLPGLCDWLSQEGLVSLTRCLALSSLSCSLTVSLFTGNVPGVLGSVALSLPALVAPKPGASALSTLIVAGAREEPLNCFLKGSLLMGCLSAKQALSIYLLDLKKGE